MEDEVVGTTLKRESDVAFKDRSANEGQVLCISGSEGQTVALQGEGDLGIGHVGFDLTAAGDTRAVSAATEADSEAGDVRDVDLSDNLNVSASVAVDEKVKLSDTCVRRTNGLLVDRSAEVVRHSASTCEA